MRLSYFVRGPIDGHYLPLPTEEPWPKFIVPEVGDLTVIYFYLYAGEHENLWLYLYEPNTDGLILDDV